MSLRRAKTPGWAAFDLKQQQKQIIEIEAHNEPFPPISNNISPLHSCQNLANNNDLSGGSFSSVIRHSVSVPNLMAIEDIRDMPHVGTSSNNHCKKIVDKNMENISLQSYEKLKELHCWADKDLIEDIMAAVENDIDKASALLQGMVSLGSLEEKKETKFKDSDCNTEEVSLNNNSLPANTGLHLGETIDLAELTHSPENGLISKKNKLLDGHASYGKMLPDDGLHLETILDNLRSIPVEPEWEEDDMYLIHRKDAIRMMRSASRHSKAANDAYLRGDHLSAQEFSLKAREEWTTAENLNAKAAKEILSIRNYKNNEWKLDLHGLHAAEAVHFLLEHLKKIESQVPVNYSANPNRDNVEACLTHAASLESLSSMEFERSNKQRQLSRQNLLEVITGKGNHSRGQAALPTAVRSFLSEKGYHYYEARAGVIIVQPKFRHL